MQRKIAYEILLASFTKGQYANLGLKNRLKELPPIKRGFVTELVNGVLRNYLLLEYQFKEYLKQDTKIDLKIILAMSCYERFYLGKDAYVSVNEYVSLGKSKAEKNFINAILRKVDKFIEPDTNTIEGLSIKYSLPLWITKMLSKQYSEEDFNFFLDDLSNEPKVFYHLNHNKAKFEDLKKYKINILDENIFTSNDNLLLTDEFKKGMMYVQDFNSSKIVNFLDLNKDNIYLDVCSAPGSKLFNALEIVNDKNAYANDLHDHRVKLIKSRAIQLGYKNVNYLNLDATKDFDKYEAYFDRILIDAPCSGLGVLKRKPDLRYHISPSDIDDIVLLQSQILDHIATRVKSGGIMVYSTCTINTKENRRQIDNFLKRHEEFELIEDTLLKERMDSDRFYVAKLLKKA